MMTVIKNAAVAPLQAGRPIPLAPGPTDDTAPAATGPGRRFGSGFGRDGSVPRGVGESALAQAKPQAPAHDLPMDAAIARLDGKRAELSQERRSLDRRIARGEHPSAGPSLQAKQAAITQQLQLLRTLRAGADKLAGLPGLDGETAARYMALMVRAEGRQTEPSAARLAIDARDLARNADRRFPADKGLVAAQHGLADRLGQAQAERRGLDALLKRGSLTGDALAAAPGQSAQINADARLAREMIAMGDRMADKPLAPAQDVARLKGLMNEAARGGVPQRRAMEIWLQAYELTR